MSFHPRMRCEIHGLVPAAAPRVLRFDGMVADLWHVEGRRGGGGRYVSPDPRIVVMMDEARLALGETPSGRPPLGPVSYVPGGTALWGHMPSARRFRHLDLHFSAARLAAILGRESVPNAPLLMVENARVQALARLIAEQCAEPDRPSAYAAALIEALVVELFHAPEPDRPGALSAEALTRATGHLRRNLGRSVSVAELADLVGLPPSSFARAFKAATGQPPHRWQIAARIERAETLLARGETPSAVAAETGFSDQAHLTRAFRRATGDTPAAWQRARLRSNRGSPVQDADGLDGQDAAEPTQIERRTAS